MNKAIKSVSGAFISFLGVVVTLTAFARSGEDLFAIVAVIFGFASLSFIGWGIEDTKIGDKLSRFFAEEGGDDE